MQDSRPRRDSHVIPVQDQNFEGCLRRTVYRGRWRQVWTLLLCVAAAVSAQAQIALPSIFTDHMVLQRNAPIHVWGIAAPGENVAVNFLGETQKDTANEYGQWSVYLRPAHAGGPFILTATGTNTITYRDVLIGDVWLASGQSNMSFPLAHGDNRGVLHEDEEIRSANYPRIRLLDLALRSAEYPLPDATVRHGWSICTPATAAKFSAVAYFFARDLQAHVKVPIGLINASWGGSPAEAWTSLDSISSDPILMPVFARRARLMDSWPSLLLQEKKEQAEVAAAKASGKVPPQFWHWDPTSWRPAGLYNAMIAPLRPFPIRGVLWYQGESNDDPDSVPIYGELFRTLITDWRSQRNQMDLPFLFVQLANFSSGSTWPRLRDQQSEALRPKDTAMVVTIDIGDPDNIHPKDKQDVGVRLALTARALVYGEALEYSGPQFREAIGEGSALRLWFSHAEKLVSRGDTLRGFEVAGSDGIFQPARAVIAGSTVLVTCATVPRPLSIRYAWAANPDANLYNQANLPAVPFQSRIWHPFDLAY